VYVWDRMAAWLRFAIGVAQGSEEGLLVSAMMGRHQVGSEGRVAVVVGQVGGVRSIVAAVK